MAHSWEECAKFLILAYCFTVLVDNNISLLCSPEAVRSWKIASTHSNILRYQIKNGDGMSQSFDYQQTNLI